MGVHMMMTVGGMVLLGTFVIFANGLLADNVQSAEQNEYVLTAVALAQSVIDEAKTKAFDQNSIGGATLTSTANCSTTLGREAGESVPSPDTSLTSGYRSSARFNDVDDYNGYTRLVKTPRASGYQVNVRVKYANEASLDTSGTSRTFCKYMVVSVTSPYIRTGDGTPIPIALSYAFLY